MDKAETALKQQLKKLNSRLINQAFSPVIYKNLKKYKRQYFGYINKNNEHTLFINCFWGNEIFHENEWLKNRIMVLDGGSYYWNVKYNIEKDELDVNGEG